MQCRKDTEEQQDIIRGDIMETMDTDWTNIELSISEVGMDRDGKKEEKIILKSSLNFDINFNNDDAVFECRLSNSCTTIFLSSQNIEGGIESLLLQLYSAIEEVAIGKENYLGLAELQKILVRIGIENDI